VNSTKWASCGGELDEVGARGRLAAQFVDLGGAGSRLRQSAGLLRLN